MMRIAICDDEEEQRLLLSGMLEKLPMPHQAQCYPDAAALLTDVESGVAFDLVFLDIYMPGDSGIVAAKALLKLLPHTSIVFCTTDTEHAVQAFALKAVHYLVKPLALEAVCEAVARAEQAMTTHRPTFSIKIGHQMRLLYLDEIAMICMAAHEAVITMMSGESLRTYVSFSTLLDQLDDTFVILSRGIAVNMAFINEMRAKECVLRNGQTILLSRNIRAEIVNAYNRYVFDCLRSRKRKQSEERS